MKLTTIGIDLAKNVFQVHGVDQHGKTVLKKQLKRDDGDLLCQHTTLPGGDGGLRRRSPLGAQVVQLGSHRQTHRPAVR